MRKVAPRYRAETRLPRHAFDPNDRARAGDVWRAFQELAVDASTANGWPPARYREHQCAFVMRSMSVVHHRPALYGERYAGETWVRRMRRGTLSTREVRLFVEAKGENLPLASGTQEWVHVDAAMKPVRATPDLIAAFPSVESEGIELPAWTPFDDANDDATDDATDDAKGDSSFEFDVWNTWMDPLGHVNHPQYLDFAEEGLMRLLKERGSDIGEFAPKAESLTFLRGLTAGKRARVRTSIVGTSALGLVSEHIIENVSDGMVCARATLHRSHGGIDLQRGSRI